jgi:hypothetical protein
MNRSPNDLLRLYGISLLGKHGFWFLVNRLRVRERFFLGVSFQSLSKDRPIIKGVIRNQTTPELEIIFFGTFFDPIVRRRQHHHGNF